MQKPLPKENLYRLLTAFLIVLALASCQKLAKQAEKETDGPREAYEQDVEMMKDPALGYVPSNRLLQAKVYRDQLWQSQTNAAISGVNWKTLGPKNQGGRTRSLLIDANDATGKTVWVGSVGGGLWKTTDITAASPVWTATDDFFGNLAISSIAQDPSNPLIMYFCTGEQGYFNADAIRGGGVWKSTNGGTSWALLASTTGFTNCEKIAVTSTGAVMLATASSGLQRSANGGTTWSKVLGTTLGITGVNGDLCYDVDIAANGDIYSTITSGAVNAGTIHKSTDGGVTFSGAQTLPISANRIELACAPSSSATAYALVENGNVVNGILQTTNGGTNWTARTEPADADGGIPASDFSRSQAWYDLSIAVDPNNSTTLMVGGVDLFKSTDGAGTWTQIAHWYGGFGFPYVHADQHFMAYAPGSSSIAYFTNDGGVFRTANATSSTPTMSDKGSNYVTAQFYACAIHPTALNNYFLAGAQDNGSHQFSSGTIQNTIQVTGGDGAFCHIDQDQPQYQFTSYVRNNYYRSSDGGSTWASANATNNNGRFINPTDYDDANNLMYCAGLSNAYYLWTNPQTGGTLTSVAAAAFGGIVTAVKVSPNTNNRVFFGANSNVFMVDAANTATPTITPISTGLPAGAYVSSIEVETGNDNHLLVTYSNYGVNSIWESTNGGTSWTSVEGNLPDMPVRWVVFNPNNNAQAVIATELGVWSTDLLNGGSTNWGASNSGLANVRVDMLQYRSSDKLLIAATHGRGLFYSDIFTSATALFSADRLITYKGVPIQFTSNSYKGTSWNWSFGDATSSTSENPTHAYTTAGQYSVTLAINGGVSTLTKNFYIQVLPNRGTPYTPTAGGDFESNPLDFGAELVAGTPWERGNSAIAGKSGTHGGTKAWVTGLTASTYADNGEANLMTPNFNFSAAGVYQLRFWAKFVTETGFDGFRIEYSLDSGRNWSPLGTAVAAGWYNNANNSGSTVFPANEAMFSGTIGSYTLYTNSTQTSALAGNPSVAFRIRFKSDVNTNAAGVAIDDFEIIGPINIALSLDLLNFSAVNHNGDGLLNWRTANENGIDKFSVEKSYDAVNFTPIGSLPAKNQLSNTYTYTDASAALNAGNAKNIFYRLKISDNTGKIKYSEVARISLDKNAPLVTIGPNPFTDFISVYSNASVQRISLYDEAGKLVFTGSSIVGNKVYLNRNLPVGTYLAKIETGSGVVTQKLVKAAR